MQSFDLDHWERRLAESPGALDSCRLDTLDLSRIESRRTDESFGLVIGSSSICGTLINLHPDPKSEEDLSQTGVLCMPKDGNFHPTLVVYHGNADSRILSIITTDLACYRSRYVTPEQVTIKQYRKVQEPVSSDGSLKIIQWESREPFTVTRLGEIRRLLRQTNTAEQRHQVIDEQIGNFAQCPRADLKEVEQIVGNYSWEHRDSAWIGWLLSSGW
jgi:hypothetical protein